jgi:hypothetical protein
VLKTVTIARDMGRTVEIGSGFTAGDRVIESSQDGIATGDEVRIAGSLRAAARPRRWRSSSRPHVLSHERPATAFLLPGASCCGKIGLPPRPGTPMLDIVTRCDAALAEGAIDEGSP